MEAQLWQEQREKEIGRIRILENSIALLFDHIEMAKKSLTIAEDGVKALEDAYLVFPNDFTIATHAREATRVFKKDIVEEKKFISDKTKERSTKMKELSMLKKSLGLK